MYRALHRSAQPLSLLPRTPLLSHTPLVCLGLQQRLEPGVLVSPLAIVLLELAYASFEQHVRTLRHRDLVGPALLERGVRGLKVLD
jgi:hypothetical protein